MGTSNWQHIPYCVEAMMKIAPQRVLDIGVGFGRWGIIAREFCDVWFGRVTRGQWKVRVEGVEAFPKNIDDYHAYFYDKIHLGDLRQFTPQFKERWNLIIFGDVLEHFRKDEALELLKWATNLGDYVMVNIPLGPNWEQGESYGNPYERHLSQWTAEEFAPFSLRRQAIFHDYIDRPAGSFILSRDDPRGLSQQLFSRSTVADGTAGEDQWQGNPSTAAQRASLLARVQSLAGELEAARQELTSIQNSIGYRLVARIRRWKVFPLLHTMARRAVRWRGLAAAVTETPSSVPR